MILNYFRVALRNLIRQKGYSVINILGLTLGLATALFIFIWVYDECTFDRFHENLEHIYRVEQEQLYNGKIFHVTVTPYPAGEGWQQEIPEIDRAVRVAYPRDLLCMYGDKRFYESRIVPVDSTVFEVFTFPLAKGNPATALTDPNSIVLTPEMAEKYFGEDDPMGQVIVIDNQYNMTVRGVLEKVPRNSTLRFDFLVPFNFAESSPYYSDSWTSNSIQTFIQLNPHADPDLVHDKLTETVKRNIDWERRGYGPEDYQTVFMANPMKRVHLHHYFGFNHTHQAWRSVLIMSFIGIFVLIIATINYTNLATARSARRAREIGLRKVSGGYRGQIIRQFFTESLITAMISVVLAFILVALLMDSFRLVSGKQIDTSVLLTTPFIISMLLMGTLSGLLAGIYPALYLSGFRPVKVLYGDPSDSGTKGVLRKVLVIIQFSVSLLLIISTTAVFLQNKYLSTFDRGYDEENLLYVELHGNMNETFPLIREAFSRLPEVEYVAGSADKPGRIGSNGGGIEWDGRPEDLEPLVSQGAVDFDFVEMLGLTLLQGRSFSRDYPADLAPDSTGAFMINQTLAKIIDKEEILGTNLTFMGIEAPIIGVIDDYCFTSLQDEVPPLALVVVPPTYISYIGVRIKAGNTEQIIDKLEREWNAVMPEYPFSYKFVKDDLDAQNQNGERMAKLLLFFTIVAIVIACMGLLGLSAFMAEKRTKEFGIRKTLGAAMVHIIVLMVRQFSWLVLASMLIAIPLGYYLMNEFLQDFAHRIHLSWYIFVVPAVGIYVLAMLTVVTYAVKAARTHPSVCLRYE